MNMDIVWQLVRYGLLAVGGFFVHKGTVTEDSLTTIVGAVMDGLAALWGIYVKFGTKAVPVSVADKPSVPTVSAATGQINSGPGIQK